MVFPSPAKVAIENYLKKGTNAQVVMDMLTTPPMFLKGIGRGESALW